MVSPTCGCCSGGVLCSPAPCLGTGQDAEGTLLLLTVNPGTKPRQFPLAVVPARLSRMAALLVCPLPWYRGAGGFLYPTQLWRGLYGPHLAADEAGQQMAWQAGPVPELNDIACY